MDDDWFPRRPMLRPGVRVVRRADGRTQVGLDARERVVLPDHPAARELATGLGAGDRPDLGSPGPRGWARLLVDRGLVVDADAVALAHRHAPPGQVAAAFARAGAAAAGRLAARAAARIGLDVEDAWRAECEGLLDAAGLTSARPGGHATARLLVSATGEPPRDSLDPWMRAGVPHLVVTNVAARVRVGPFVAPGLTACLRCVDAHGSDRDPGHGLVVEQHDPREGEPCDPLLMRLGLAWAVRDLVSYVEGDTPATWSASYLLAGTPEPERHAWSRHPRCGCAWGDGLATG